MILEIVERTRKPSLDISNLLASVPGPERATGLRCISTRFSLPVVFDLVSEIDGDDDDSDDGAMSGAV